MWIASAGDQFFKKLKAYRDDKRLAAEAEGVEGDFSLAQCSREMIENGLLPRANATNPR